jgi:hypothetical protein
VAIEAAACGEHMRDQSYRRTTSFVPAENSQGLCSRFARSPSDTDTVAAGAISSEGGGVTAARTRTPADVRKIAANNRIPMAFALQVWQL